MRILVIEDDNEAAGYMIKGLSESGHMADHAEDGETGLMMASGGGYDVLIVDCMIPKIDGLSMVEGLRNSGENVPIMFLSALSAVDDRVKGLKAGGDDYLTKPYAFIELLARIESLVRRRNPVEVVSNFQLADLRMDLLTRQVLRSNSEIQLQPREFKLLQYLMRHAGHVVTRTMLLENVWEYHFDPQTNVIDVHISRLRSKIDKGYDTQLLHTVRGAGYCLREPD